MKKILVLCTILAFAAACNSSGNSSDPSWSTSKEMERFHELTIQWDKNWFSEAPIMKEIVISHYHGMNLHVQKVTSVNTPSEECYGYTLLSDEDYESILALIAAANVSGYVPPVCDPLISEADQTIVNYLKNDNTWNEFSTSEDPERCDYDSKVANMLEVVQEIASTNITNCSEDLLIQEDAQNAPDEKSKL